MASITDVCNMALSHLGISKEIGNVTTEQSTEAAACRRFYDSTRESVLTDYAWPFAARFYILNLVEESPNNEWAYSYRYPSGCLTIRRILSGLREDTDDSKIPYKIAQDDQGILIYTDKEDAEVEYTADVDDEDLFSASFKLALSYRLAGYIAPRLTAGDPFKLGDKAMAKYELEISKAVATAFNENKMNSPQNTPSIQARE